VLGARLVAIAGEAQVESGVVHLIARKVEDISADLRKIERASAATPRARNFH
jgi:error-prone DNA polymerase